MAILSCLDAESATAGSREIMLFGRHVVEVCGGCERGIIGKVIFHVWIASKFEGASRSSEKFVISGWERPEKKRVQDILRHRHRKSIVTDFERPSRKKFASFETNLVARFLTCSINNDRDKSDPHFEPSRL
jgi:hypothetical protein